MGRRVVTILFVLAAGAVGAGCSQGIDLASNEDPEIVHGAELFHQRCAGCHTLEAVGAQGSATNVNSREYRDGPNFNQRAETYEQVLYAIRNGGFSSGPMPQNIVVGADAEAVAKFLAKYSGQQAERASGPVDEAPAGATGGGG